LEKERMALGAKWAKTHVRCPKMALFTSLSAEWMLSFEHQN
jgi:hypothetical protein